jgi:hypothetical protein
MIASLASLATARIARSPRLWLSLGVWCSLSLGFAMVARAQGWAHGADRVLLSVYGSLALPFIAYSIARVGFAGRSMASSTAPLVAFGAQPWRAAFASVCVTAIATALVGACLAASIALIAHGSADPAMGGDALVSAYVGGLGGAAYATWFAFGTTIGRRGGGRILFLALDWVMGGAESPTALATPRGHLRSLLGGAAPLNIPERKSALMLVSLMALCTFLAIRERARVTRAR